MSELDALLRPFRQPEPLRTKHDDAYRVDAVPPDVARRALALVDVAFATTLLEGQPPAAGLVDVAEECQGVLVGQVAPSRRYLRLDGVQVAAGRGRDLAELVLDRWSEAVDVLGRPSADGVPPLDRAVAEAWPDAAADEACWEGQGRDLLDGVDALPVEARDGVVGLWWD